MPRLGLGLGLGIGRGGGFNPSSIANLALWLDPNYGNYSDTAGTTPVAANGSTVKRRQSRVGTSYVTASTGSATIAYNALGSTTALRHTGLCTSGWVTNNFSLTSGQAWTLFLSQKCLARGLIQPSGPGRGTVEAGLNNFYGYYQAAPFTNRGTVSSFFSSQDQEVLCYQSTASNLVLRQNGTQTNVLSALASGAVNSNISIHGFVDNTAWPYYGDDYEVLWYDRILTAAEIAAVERYLLSKAPIKSPSLSKIAIINIGDSITAGAGANLNSSSWVELATATAGSSYERLNLGIPSSTAAQWVSTFFSQYASQVYNASRPGHIFTIALGTNDIIAGATAAAIYANIKSIANSCKALGSNIKVMIADVMARTAFTAPQNTIKDTLNGLLAADCNVATGNAFAFTKAVGTTYCEGLITPSAQSITTWDGTHPNDAGNLTYSGPPGYLIPLL